MKHVKTDVAKEDRGNDHIEVEDLFKSNDISIVGIIVQRNSDDAVAISWHKDSRVKGNKARAKMLYELAAYEDDVQ